MKVYIKYQIDTPNSFFRLKFFFENVLSIEFHEMNKTYC